MKVCDFQREGKRESERTFAETIRRGDPAWNAETENLSNTVSRYERKEREVVGNQR